MIIVDKRSNPTSKGALLRPKVSRQSFTTYGGWKSAGVGSVKKSVSTKLAERQIPKEGDDCEHTQFYHRC
jgi:hypothetical protein